MYADAVGNDWNRCCLMCSLAYEVNSGFIKNGWQERQVAARLGATVFHHSH
jgi:hypothetical protein